LDSKYLKSIFDVDLNLQIQILASFGFVFYFQCPKI
jgi:hypothetical protein